ncbi:InlB B-repeat-containing protein [Pseudohalioglobus sediminis]|uniref:InlB B-repeat-containing protein n=1 Tax=Pseudohalioglobus sediminis TaxID=2606449 RepID=UPI001CB6C3DB|nr:hypothetical protein [Pseudohalioglobus sediminis]
MSACRLDVSTDPGGKVLSASSKIDCSGEQGDCVAWYGSAEPVNDTLEAIADAGYSFVGWSGDCTGSAATCQLSVGARTPDRAVRAHFQQGAGAVLAATPSPGGVVRSEDSLLRCGMHCAASYAAGSRVTLSAEPLPGYRLQSWGGDCANTSAAQCTLTINSRRRNVSATFVADAAPALSYDGVYEVSADTLAFDSFVVRDGRISGAFFLQVPFELDGQVDEQGAFTFTAASNACQVTFLGEISAGSLDGTYDASGCNRADGVIRGSLLESLATTDFVNFESGQVRPLALSPDGSRLFVTNTPNNTLDIFAVDGAALTPLHTVPVGLEPVAVAARSNNEVWVVNHLSDSISIVDVGAEVPQVVRTLQVGDEPRDIVFAGPQRRRAFITTARRGQNSGYPLEEYREAGLPRADIWVFDSASQDFVFSGKPLTVINLFGDVPRALATNASGSRVYAAVFMSGNGTTTIFNAPEVNAGKPGPDASVHGEPQPATGLIVKYDGQAWRDEAGNDWSERVRLSLPDYDVFTLNANAPVPREIDRASGVGTTLFNMAYNTARQELYVTNFEARNEVRFEGPGTLGSSVRGHIADSRISVIDDNQQVRAVDLNPHVDYSVPQGQGVPAAIKARSLAQPVGIAVSPDGERVYVAAMGSNKVAAIDADALDGSYQPDGGRQVKIPGGGPTGLALDAAGKYLYVLARYNNSVVTVDTSSLQVAGVEVLANPEPAHVVNGRPFLYDATLTSSNGTTACASCHIFGDTDHLAWDLGNPDEEVVPNPLVFTQSGRPEPGATFHPMKGPMTTQTFRGINDSGPMHWRGDRTGSNREVVDGRLESVEAAAFKEFRGAFVGLLGRQSELAEADLQAFTDFALTLVPPPNPLRALDNSLNPSQQLGEQIYFNEVTTGGNLLCNDCHTLDPLRNQFGTGGRVSDEGPGITEDFKVPHFRNLYTKVGMFGLSPNFMAFGNAHQGDQVRGFGYLHDGSMDTLDHFFSAIQFNLAANDERRFAIIDFVMASDSNLAPVVGQQVTLDASSRYPAAAARLDLMIQRALAETERPECDLVAHGVVAGERRGAWLRADGFFHLDSASADPLSVAAIKQLAKQPERAFTFSCVPPGSGKRIALDSDGDGIYNYDQR